MTNRTTDDNMLETLSSTVVGNAPVGRVQVQIEGDNNIVGSHVDTVKNTYNTQIVVKDAESGRRQRIDITFDRTRYNLFVIDEKNFIYDHFVVPLDAVFAEGTPEELKDQFLPLEKKACDILKKYPAVFVPVNQIFGANANADDVVVFGKIREIVPQENGVFIEFYETGDDDKGKLYEISEQLGMGKPREIPEFKKVHWALKDVDLINILETHNIHFCERRI